jgi:hypothetical protein
MGTLLGGDVNLRLPLGVLSAQSTGATKQPKCSGRPKLLRCCVGVCVFTVSVLQVFGRAVVLE